MGESWLIKIAAIKNLLSHLQLKSVLILFPPQFYSQYRYVDPVVKDKLKCLYKFVVLTMNFLA